MSVVLEFTIDGADFSLGQVVSGAARGMYLELERLVPTGDMVMPFLWATGDDHDAFEANLRDHPAVRELYVLDKIENSGLYRIEWKDEPTDLVEGIAESNAVILEASGNESWAFRLRFPDHGALSVFHNYVIENELPIHIERTYTLTEATAQGHQFGLSREQREALVLALQRDYFATPSEVTLDELADELGITRQAMSNRIRRGNEKVLQQVLLSSVGDFD